MSYLCSRIVLNNKGFMVKTFDEFIDKKRSKSPNRAYEHKYPQNLDLIKDLLKQCKEKRTSTMWSLYSYRSIAEYMYYGLEMQEISLEGLRKAISRIAKANNLEL